MKIYYNVNESNDTCKNKCPFADIGYKGETGPDCMVGSVTCQECKFCYGKGGDDNLCLVFDDKNSKFEQCFNFKPMPYVKCLFARDKISMTQRLQWFWHHGKQLLFNKDDF